MSKISCPSCGAAWDTGVNNSCSCGASLKDKVRNAQMLAGEQAVIDNLKERGLLRSNVKHDDNCLFNKPTNTFAPNLCTCNKSIKIPDKGLPVRPSLYAMYYQGLKEIAYTHGYNLCIHGSMNRDFDLVAFPWKKEANPNHFEMAEEMRDFIGGRFNDGFGDKCETGCYWYPINIWRNTPFTAEKDQQYYIDMKIFPPLPESQVGQSPEPKEDEWMPTEEMERVVAEEEKRIRRITPGTLQYWKERCTNREKMDDPSYSNYERSNCRYFHSILVKKEI